MSNEKIKLTCETVEFNTVALVVKIGLQDLWQSNEPH